MRNQYTTPSSRFYGGRRLQHSPNHMLLEVVQSSFSFTRDVCASRPRGCPPTARAFLATSHALDLEAVCDIRLSTSFQYPVGTNVSGGMRIIGAVRGNYILKFSTNIETENRVFLRLTTYFFIKTLQILKISVHTTNWDSSSESSSDLLGSRVPKDIHMQSIKVTSAKNCLEV